MKYYSPRRRGVPTITDQNFADYRRPIRRGSHCSESGYQPRDLKAQPIASLPGSRRMPREFLIPENEWAERIEERSRKRGTLVDRLRATRLPYLNQSPSWYCWAYGPTHLLMSLLALRGDPLRVLVPESVAGPIKNYRKQGGWGSQAIAFMAREGIADASAWPRESHAAANRRQYYEPSRANALQTRVLEYWDLESFEEKMSCLLQDIMVTCGYAQMGHQMMSADPVVDGRGRFGCEDIDSYARGGQFNVQRLLGRQAVGDDMIAVRSVTPNNLPAVLELAP